MKPSVMPAPLEEYLFDLNGYLILENALCPDEVGELNAALDSVPPIEKGEWYGNVRRRDQKDELGINLQQVVELGEPFEKLIDHPSWIDRVTRFVGGDDGLQLAENFANLRAPGKAFHLHSGGHKRRIRTSYRFHNNQFRCGQINILIALTDMGPGDGATMVIPGSHKSNLIHPHYERADGLDPSVDMVPGAVEVNAKAGDAVLFVDSIAHGSAERVNPGERRVVIYRYGPQWGNYFGGYHPSSSLLARLTERRRHIVQPMPPIYPPEDRT